MLSTKDHGETYIKPPFCGNMAHLRFNIHVYEMRDVVAEVKVIPTLKEIYSNEDKETNEYANTHY